MEIIESEIGKRADNKELMGNLEAYIHIDIESR